jgi:hypothetical protein
MCGVERTTSRATPPVCRASTYAPWTFNSLTTRGVPAMSTRSRRTLGSCQTMPRNVSPGCVITSTRSPLSSSSPVCRPGPGERFTVPVSLREAASTTRRRPPAMVTMRRPSVLTMSGSSTPGSWTLVDECGAWDAMASPGTRASVRGRMIGSPPRPYGPTCAAVAFRRPLSNAPQSSYATRRRDGDGRGGEPVSLTEHAAMIDPAAAIAMTGRAPERGSVPMRLGRAARRAGSGEYQLTAA